MGSYMMGFHYDRPKRGNGVSIEWHNGYIGSLTKKSALNIKRELINMGTDKDLIVIEPN